MTIHRHHIVPKHMGGLDEDFNIMELTRREHYIAHLILYKLYGHMHDLNAARLLIGEQPINPMTGVKRPELTERNKKAVGENGYNWKGGRGAGTEYRKQYQKDWKEKNKEKLSAERRENYAANIDEAREKSRLKAEKRRRKMGVPVRGRYNKENRTQ